MNRQEELKITRNLSQLIKHTTNFTELTALLYSLQILRNPDVQTLESKVTDVDKHGYFYRMLPSKGERCFTCLIIALIATDNDKAVKLLTGHGIEELRDLGISEDSIEDVYSIILSIDKERKFNVTKIKPPVLDEEVTLEENTEEFIVKEENIMAICDIFCQSSEFHNRRDEFFRSLLKTNELMDLRSLPPSTPFHEICSRALASWISSQSSSATFQSLITILKGREFNAVADQLIQSTVRKKDPTGVNIKKLRLQKYNLLE